MRRRIFHIAAATLISFGAAGLGTAHAGTLATPAFASFDTSRLGAEPVSVRKYGTGRGAFVRLGYRHHYGGVKRFGFKRHFGGVKRFGFKRHHGGVKRYGFKRHYPRFKRYHHGRVHRHHGVKRFGFRKHYGYRGYRGHRGYRY